ncbi:hypothetical protein Q9L58_005658 [Maublancomyces gigas]|uniref:ATP synthase subunit d, mitochondrial n=1 Tax=Discina gigas TaxID=1032678 RepID=A0ABR3GHH5_9PEZI
MSIQIIRCVRRVGIPLQFRFPTPRTVHYATPLLPRHGVLLFRWSELSRPLSSTRKLTKEARGVHDEWVDRGVPDVYKWNKRMDKLAEQSKTDLRVIGEWARLLEEGVAAKLPNIEDTLIRHAELSPNLAKYMGEVQADYMSTNPSEDRKYGVCEEGIEGLTAEEVESLRIKEQEEECKLEDVAREELENELQREQGNVKRNTMGRRF